MNRKIDRQSDKMNMHIIPSFSLIFPFFHRSENEENASNTLFTFLIVPIHAAALRVILYCFLPGITPYFLSLCVWCISHSFFGSFLVYFLVYFLFIFGSFLVHFWFIHLRFISGSYLAHIWFIFGSCFVHGPSTFIFFSFCI